MKTLFFVLVCLCAAQYAAAFFPKKVATSAPAVDVEKTTVFSLFEGMWRVERYSSLIDGDTIIPYTESTSVNGTFNLTRTAFDGILLGDYTWADPARHGLTDGETLRITSNPRTQPRGGVLAFHSMEEKSNTFEFDEDEDDTEEKEKKDTALVSLQFDLSAHNDVLLAIGRYKAKSPGTYTLTIPAPDQFILVLTPDASDAATRTSTTYVGKKHVTPQKGGLFSNMGPTLMMVGVFVISRMFGPNRNAQPARA